MAEPMARSVALMDLMTARGSQNKTNLAFSRFRSAYLTGDVAGQEQSLKQLQEIGIRIPVMKRWPKPEYWQEEGAGAVNLAVTQTLHRTEGLSPRESLEWFVTRRYGRYLYKAMESRLEDERRKLNRQFPPDMCPLDAMPEPQHSTPDPLEPGWVTRITEQNGQFTEQEQAAARFVELVAEEPDCPNAGKPFWAEVRRRLQQELGLGVRRRQQIVHSIRSKLLRLRRR
jgi:hypothetical protein